MKIPTDTTDTPVDKGAEETAEDNLQTVDDELSVDPCEASRQEAAQWKEQYLRALADYRNLERRSQQRESEIRTFAAERAIIALLPALDSLDQAGKHIQDAGFQLVQKEFAKALAACSVVHLEVVGKPFDPFFMECIEVVEGIDNQVTEEVSAGYMLGEKVVRPAKVKVGKKTQKSKDS